MTFEDEIKDSFSYNPETGDLVRVKIAKNNERLVGTTCRSKNVNGYFNVRFNGKTLKVHRIAFLIMTGAWPTGIVDHINGNKSDNRWCNLRECTKAQNGQNVFSKVRSKSGVRGVYRSQCGEKWVVRIRNKGERYHLGTFATKELAVAARMEAVRRFHGEFAGRQMDDGVLEAK